MQDAVDWEVGKLLPPILKELTVQWVKQIKSSTNTAQETKDDNKHSHGLLEEHRGIA